MFKKRSLLLALTLAVTASVMGPVKAQETKIVIRQLDNLVVQSPAIAAAFKEFQKTHPNVELEHEAIANFTEVIQFSATGEAAPDLFVVNVLDDPQRRSLIDAEAFYSLDQFADWEAFLSRFPNPELAVQEGNNKYGDTVISMKFDSDLWWHQYYINLNLYEKAGIVGADGKAIIPTTWKEVVANAYTIKEKTGAYGFSLPGANTNWMTFFFWTCQLSSIAYGPRGLGYDMRTGEFTSSKNECFKTVINDLLKMRDDQITPPDMLTLDDEPVRALFAEDKVATVLTGIWAITGWEQTHKEFTNYSSLPVPLVNTDAPLQYYGSNPAGVLFAISSKTAEDPEKLAAVWDWYKFIYSPEFARIWADTGNGLSIFTPGEPSAYATQQNRGYFETSKFFAAHPEPQLTLRNAEIGKLQQTLIGPTEGEMLIGLYSGQLTDVDAALADLDKRYTEAFNKALEDAAAAGVSISKEDFIVRDWDPTKPYSSPLKPDYYPGKQ